MRNSTAESSWLVVCVVYVCVCVYVCMCVCARTSAGDSVPDVPGVAGAGEGRVVFTTRVRVARVRGTKVRH